MERKIRFDVMLKGRFIGTLTMPVTLDVIEGYEGDMPIIRGDAFTSFVERKMPTLKGKAYNIAF